MGKLSQLLDRNVHSFLAYGFAVLFSSIVVTVVADSTVNFLVEVDSLSTASVALAQKNVYLPQVLGESDTTFYDYSEFISNIQVTQVSPSSVRVTWATDLPAMSQIVYGEDLPVSSLVEESVLKNYHSIVLENLSSSRAIYFRIQSEVSAEVNINSSVLGFSLNNFWSGGESDLPLMYASSWLSPEETVEFW